MSYVIKENTYVYLNNEDDKHVSELGFRLARDTSFSNRCFIGVYDCCCGIDDCDRKIAAFWLGEKTRLMVDPADYIKTKSADIGKSADNL